jgi:Undecaprenyl-phosphate glucose phosphotransferase
VSNGFEFNSGAVTRLAEDGMSGLAQEDFSPRVVRSSTEPGAAAAAVLQARWGQSNVVVMAVIACSIELLAIAAAFWVSLVIGEMFVTGFHTPQLWFGTLVCLFMVASIAERGDYNAAVLLARALRPWSLARASLQTSGAVSLVAFGSIAATGTLLDRSNAPLSFVGMSPTELVVWMVAFLTAGYLAVLSVRLLGRATFASLVRPCRVVIVGNPDRCSSLVESLDQARQSLRVLGLIDHEKDPSPNGLVTLKRFYRLPVLGRLEQLVDMVQRNEVDAVVVALPWSETAAIREIVDCVGGSPVDVLLAPDLDGLELPTAPPAALAGIPLLRAVHPPLLGWQAFLKRAEDIVIAGGITLLAAPLMIAIAALVKLTSQGPVFFRQKRVGYKGQVFEALKFRTMYTHLSDAHASVQTRRGDPRITPFGAWLRRRSLDELPQLLNVLRGDMSLVGPRPHAIGTTARGVPLDQAANSYRLRQRVRPGLTGWAQVNGKRGPLHTCEEVMDRVTLDLEYIQEWSLALDLKIIWLTIGLLIHDKNAY